MKVSTGDSDIKAEVDRIPLWKRIDQRAVSGRPPQSLPGSASRDGFATVARPVRDQLTLSHGGPRQVRKYPPLGAAEPVQLSAARQMQIWSICTAVTRTLDADERKVSTMTTLVVAPAIVEV